MALRRRLLPSGSRSWGAFSHALTPLRRGLPALLALLVCPGAWGQLPAEFRVNSYTTGSQYQGAAASRGSDGFVVAWTSVGQDGSLWGVFGQRLDAAGGPLGGEFQVNSQTFAHQGWPAVAPGPQGSFVVAWESYSQDASLTWGVYAQRFDSGGVPQGAEFRVNAHTTNNQRRPAVASAANGDFVVTWHSYDQDGSDSGVFARRFDSAGLAQGSEFQVNSHTTGRQDDPAVAADAAGNFLVAWRSDGQDGSSQGVFGRRFDSAGAPVGSEFQVNSYATGRQAYPAAAADASGSLFVVWASDGQDGSGWGIFGQRYDSAGTPQGAEFAVNTYTTDLQSVPSVASEGAGRFVVAWQSLGQDRSHYGVFGQRYEAGTRQGSEFQVNAYTSNAQQLAAVAAAPGGDVLVVWQSFGQGGPLAASDVFARRFGDLIFRDGFE